jgi:hypothetical protein
MPGNEIKPKQEQGRPPGIKFLSILCILIGLFYLLKLSQVLFKWSLLKELPLTITPAYLAADSLVWCVAGISLAWSLWNGKSWSSSAVLALSFLYSLVFWIDRIWIAEPEGLVQRWPFNLLLTIIGLGLILLVLRRKSSQDYFQKNPAKIP